MLARRFTIVCLMLMVFGMLLSILVAKASRLPHSWDRGSRRLHLRRRRQLFPPAHAVNLGR